MSVNLGASAPARPECLSVYLRCAIMFVLQTLGALPTVEENLRGDRRSIQRLSGSTNSAVMKDFSTATQMRRTLEERQKHKIKQKKAEMMKMMKSMFKLAQFAHRLLTRTHLG